MDLSINIVLIYQSLKKRIKNNEDFSYKPYKDKLGYLTVGYGHLIKQNDEYLFKKKFKKKELDALFLHDFNKCVIDYYKYLIFYSSSKKDKELLIEMIFQMGIKGVLKFKKLLKNINKGNKNLVCFDMMQSLWYKQTPNRVKNLILNYLKK